MLGHKKKIAFYIKISLKSCCLFIFTSLQQLQRGIKLSLSPLGHKERNCQDMLLKNTKQPKLQSQGKLFIWQTLPP